MVAPRARLSHPVLVLLPLPAFAVAAAPVAFLQAEMWNSVPMQVAAWFALFALIDLAGMARPRSRLWIVLILLACAFAQTVFLVEAAVLKRANDLTEYKETVIAFLCLAYTVSVLIRARAAAQAASSPGMKSASPNTAIRTSIP